MESSGAAKRLCVLYPRCYFIHEKVAKCLFKSFWEKLLHICNLSAEPLLHFSSVPERSNKQQSEGDESSFLTHFKPICFCCVPYKMKPSCRYKFRAAFSLMCSPFPTLLGSPNEFITFSNQKGLTSVTK